MGLLLTLLLLLLLLQQTETEPRQINICVWLLLFYPFVWINFKFSPTGLLLHGATLQPVSAFWY